MTLAAHDSQEAQRAKELIKAIVQNESLRNQLISATSREQRRQVLQQAGFGDVQPEHIPNAALPAAAELEELTDTQMQRLAGGGGNTVTTATTTTTVTASASAAVAAA